MDSQRRAAIELTIVFPNGGRVEPIDIALIETIRSQRSISGAGRQLGLSYRKTWLMTDALNRTFSARMIETYPGRSAGGAEVTSFGERVVALYRSIERRTRSSTSAAMAELIDSLDPRFALSVDEAVRSA